MARIKGKDLYLKNDDQIYFGNNSEAALWYDNGDLLLNHTVSGIDPTAPGHLVTKRYLEDYVSTASGSGVSDHGLLSGLSDDDHPQYVLADGSRGFTGPVDGVYPVEDNDLIPKGYLVGVLDGSIQLFTTIQGSLIQFEYAEDGAESSTNSTTFQNKLRLTVSGIPNGNYRIAWTFQWRHSKSNTYFSARVQVDDTETIFTYTASPYVDVLYWQPVTSFYYYDVLVSGTHTIDLDYLSSSVASTSYIKETKIEFWRIV